MKNNEFIRNASPKREAVVAAVTAKEMQTADVAKEFELTQRQAYNMLRQLHEAGLIGRTGEKLEIYWGKPKEKQKIKRTKPVLNGTMRQKLSGAALMGNPYRAGSMDAYQIPSGARI